MCCSERGAKMFLIVTNTLFILLGLGLLVPGVMMVANVDVLNENIQPLMQQVSVGVFNLGDLAKGLSIALIALGSLVLIVAILGACGACCGKKGFLIAYAIIVGIFFLGKVVMVTLWFLMNDTITNTLKSEMRTALLDKYSNDDLTTDKVSSAWNFLFMELECCGIDTVTSATNDFDTTGWQQGSPSTDIPLGCCPGVTVIAYASGSATNAGCPSASGTNPVGQYSKGCYDTVFDMLRTYTIVFIVILVTILLVELSAVISAITICKHRSKGDEVV